MGIIPKLCHFSVTERVLADCYPGRSECFKVELTGRPIRYIIIIIIKVEEMHGRCQNGGKTD